MYCMNCGKELDENARFCPNCGMQQHFAGQQQFASNGQVGRTAEVVEKRPAKVWTVFSTVGKILGIVCLCVSLIPYFNYFSLVFGVVGIVMSCLGRKAKTEETDKNCRIGLTLSIIAVAVSLVMIIVYAIALKIIFFAMMFA